MKNTLREVTVSVALIIALGFTATALVYYIVRQSNDRQLVDAVAATGQDLQAHVLEAMSHYPYGLRGVRGAIQVTGSDNAGPGLLRAFFIGRDLQAEFPGAHGFGLIRRVPATGVDDFVAAVRRQTDPGFRVQPFESFNGEHYLVQFVEPVPGNQRTLGMDIASEPRRAQAALAAMRSGEPQLSAPLTLRLDQGEAYPSMWMLLPVYGAAAVPADVPGREAALTGWVFTPLILHEALQTLPLKDQDGRLLIRDVTEGAGLDAFFDRGTGLRKVGADYRWVHELPVYGRQWRFEFTAGPGFIEGLHFLSPLIVLYTGGLFTLVLAALGSLLGAGFVRRDGLVQDKMRLAAIVESSTDGIIGKTLQGVVTSWNKGAEDLFGYTAEHAVGRPLEELIIPVERAGEEQDILTRIGRGERIYNFDTVRRHRNGTLIDVAANISPILNEHGEVTGASKTVRDVSVQKRAQATILELNARLEELVAERTSQLRQTNLMLTSVLRSASEVSIIATDRTGLIQVFNHGAERLLGYEEIEVVGRHTPELFHLPEELARGEDDGFTALAHGVARIHEWTFVRKDGSRFPVQLMVTPIHDDADELTGYLGIAVDITERKAAEHDLTSARDQLLMAAEVAQLGIWSLNLADSTLQWNDRMFEFYSQPVSLREQGLRYEHWLERVHPDDQASASGRMQDALTGGIPYDPVFRVQSPEGRVRVIQSGAHVERDASGRAVRVTGINLDITAQRELEAHLLEAKEQADAASAAKSYFLANMSHEIRTPMNAVLGMLQLLRNAGLNARQLGYVDNAYTAGRSLLGLLNDILDYSKIEAGKLQLEVHAFDLDKLLRELAVVLAGNQSNNDVEVIFELDPSVPLHLLGDSLRLKQVLINLAGNALKFTPHGQVVVSLRRMGPVQPALRLRVEVQDSGIGISKHHLEHIFTGFSQAQASTTRRYGGTGLGLAICRRLVALMGSELKVRSDLDKGSCFWFDLDLGVQEGTGEPPLQERRLRVLVVDDNDVARQVLARTVAGMGWEVEAVASGIEALARVHEGRDLGHSYDVILMDWRMPGMDGVSTARHLAEAAEGQGPVVVIMVTACGQAALNQLAEGESAPFRGLLGKPVTPSQLAEAVHGALSDHPGLLPTPVAAAGVALAGLKVLVVEDNPLNRQVIMELLRQEGALVELADGGLEGVFVLTTSDIEFDVVLMDLQMPDIDGFEATRRMRADPRFATLPILAMTANASSTDRQACLAAGMNGHLAKPVNFPEVVAALQHWTRRRVTEVTPAVADDNALTESLGSILTRMGGNRELLNRLLGRFEAEIRRLLGMLQAGLASQDRASVERALHTLKGTAGNLGARALSGLAGELELQLHNAPRAMLSVIITREVMDVLDALTVASHKALSLMIQAPATRPVRQALDTRQFRQRLEAIAPLLESHNLRGVNLVEALGDYDLPCAPAQWEALNAHLGTLNFKAAAGVARHLLRTTP